MRNGLQLVFEGFLFLLCSLGSLLLPFIFLCQHLCFFLASDLLLALLFLEKMFAGLSLSHPLTRKFRGFVVDSLGCRSWSRSFLRLLSFLAHALTS